jgi:hypothetical protein
MACRGFSNPHGDHSPAFGSCNPASSSLGLTTKPTAARAAMLPVKSAADSNAGSIGQFGRPVSIKMRCIRKWMRERGSTVTHRFGYPSCCARPHQTSAGLAQRRSRYHPSRPRSKRIQHRRCGVARPSMRPRDARPRRCARSTIGLGPPLPQGDPPNGPPPAGVREKSRSVGELQNRM